MSIRPKHLADFLTILDAVLRNQNEPKKTTAGCSLFLIVIDNLPMLTISFGHSKVAEIIDSLTVELEKKLKGTVGAFQIQSDQIALIVEKSEAPELIHIELNLKNIIRKFGLQKDFNLHISAKLGYSPLNHLHKPAEAYLSELYQQTMRQSFSLTGFDTHTTPTQHSKQEMLMANQISEALERQQLCLAYQPIVAAATGKTSHHECLLRLRNDDGGLDSAGVFIPIAERMGFINLIDILTLEMALTKLSEASHATLALNISHLTIGNRDWLKKFFASVDSTIAARLHIEITETATNQNLRETAYFIASIQEAGCLVALDDFGSGYTSYKQIQALSLDMIKIDGSLIAGIDKNRHNQVLVRSLVDYFKEYGLKVIAEHVDSDKTAEILREYDIDYFQGYYFGEAVTNV